MQDTRRKRITTFALFVADTFFLWMFFSAEGLELAARGGQVSAPFGIDPVPSAFEFSSVWRHGMAGGWPLYMPGFFVTGVAIWLWSDESSILTLMLRATRLKAASIVAAWLLAPLGAAIIVDAFTKHTGFVVAGDLPHPTIAGMGAGLYTLLTWQTFIAAGRCALLQRSFKPYLPALILTMGLGAVRPMLVDDFVSLWSRRVLEGNHQAIISVVVIPILAAVLLRIQQAKA